MNKKEIDIAFMNKEQLDSNIYIGKSNHENLCLILNPTTRKPDIVFPTNITLDKYLEIKNKVKESGLGEPDEQHLQIVSLCIAIDYLNNLDLFKKKKDIYNNCSIFETTFIEDSIIINIPGLGKIMIDYDTTKEIINSLN